MTLMDAQDELGREIQHKRHMKKAVADAKEAGKQEKEAEAKRHEENKQQGMI